MATQSLYRRYRPRRFSEVRGQDHVVRALRTAVAEGREGQAYLFSGPRGTGKTTSARILAKVLNCTDPREGEPCCECASCLAVERGTSYDVHELDAASNNGVDAMRDLIDKASLGTPGRHKVYILDEVHMLTKPAEAALLKTLEEPPPHVVFVLATTDPQKMSDTIRSRTQHLQFHLFSADELEAHVRWVAEDAGLDVSDAAVDRVVDLGAGSARDALSALELVATTGGDGAESVPLHEFVEAMIDQDAGRALAMVANAISLGRDPRTLTEELIGYLRNGFLSIMAPDLVQLPSQRVDELSGLAHRLGAPGLVRGIEQLGAALTEMRQAPDPRVLLDVAVVHLTIERADSDLGALVTRIAKLERQVADGAGVASASASASAPVDPGTGRAALGGRARRSEPPPATAAAATTGSTGGSAGDATTAAGDVTPTEADAESEAPPSSTDAEPSDVPAAPAMTQEVWEETVRPALRGMARAVFAPAEYVTSTGSTLTLLLPNPVHREKCEQHRAHVEQALAAAAGGPVELQLVLDGEGGARRAAGAAAATEPASASVGGSTADASTSTPNADERGGSPELPDDDDVDLSDLVDAPPEHVKSPIDRLAEAFPGSEMVEEQR